MTEKEKALKITFESVDAQLEKLNKDLAVLTKTRKALEVLCEHKWEYSHTDYHKHVDFDMCVICGETR